MMLGGVYLLWRMTMWRAVSGARPANTQIGSNTYLRKSNGKFD